MNILKLSHCWTGFLYLWLKVFLNGKEFALFWELWVTSGCLGSSVCRRDCLTWWKKNTGLHHEPCVSYMPRKPSGFYSWCRVGHDWATSLSLFTFMYWRRKWQPTPVFLPGESQGWGSLVGSGVCASLGSHRVRHDWSDLAAAAYKILQLSGF